jgi:hypothetical protein
MWVSSVPSASYRIFSSTLRSVTGGGGFSVLGALGAVGKSVEVVEDVIAIDDEFGTLLNEAVATERGGFVNRAGHGIHGAAGFEGLLRGDERAAAARGLDHQQGAAPASDDAIAIGKGLFVRDAIDWILAEHGTVFCDALGEGLIFGRVKLADAGADDGNGAAFAARAASCAAVSMPRARPLMTV